MENSQDHWIELILRGLYMIVEALELKLGKRPRISELRQMYKRQELI